MKSINSNTFWIFISTFTLMVIFLFAVLKTYDLTLNETKKSHQLQQMEMAKAASNGIHIYLELMIEDMYLLASILGSWEKSKKENRKSVDNIFSHYKKKIIKTIFLANVEGTIIYTKGDSLQLWAKSMIDGQKYWVQNPENWGKYWISKVRPNIENDVEQGMSFLMLVPLFQSSQDIIQDNTAKKVTGLAGYLLDFDSLIQKFISPLKLSKSDFAWIIDGNGRLIYHPTHTDMLLRNTKETSTECNDCHTSFKTQNRMLVEPASVGEYSISDEPTKIMAYMPMELANEKWVLVISSLLPKVTENLREKFRLFFILGIIILAAIVLFGLSLYYVNTKRIRAEEAKRQSEQMHQLHEQLNQASKLASIGELVDTMAHEINTPAGIISAQADAVLLQMAASENKYSEEINVIKAQTRRISTYTKSLLSYSKRVPFQPKVSHINKLLDECLYLLGHRFRAKNVLITKNYGSNIKPLSFDYSQMAQVFINILNNAVDVLEDKNGIIKINVQNVQKNENLSGIKNIKGVEIEISDNGFGIQDKNQEQIFDPFFSTKFTSKGTGLGLYISKMIVQRHNGKIEVSSEIGQGTSFRIYLPCHFNGDK